ncbi:helix-turn-helix domain-containing protein, partial [Rhodoplanes sp. SY1]|uniref:helix-turn-helix domain-containing protein n=1 Tax=Rhodoplanes sp. SY1 TaxID=3166646 RepID=UPI0038B53E61
VRARTGRHVSSCLERADDQIARGHLHKRRKDRGENQAATLLGVSVRTLQAWRVRGGGPPYVKIGCAVRYQRRALVTFQQQNTVTSTTEADARRSRS